MGQKSLVKGIKQITRSRPIMVSVTLNSGFFLILPMPSNRECVFPGIEWALEVIHRVSFKGTTNSCVSTFTALHYKPERALFPFFSKGRHTFIHFFFSQSWKLKPVCWFNSTFLLHFIGFYLGLISSSTGTPLWLVIKFQPRPFAS